MSSKKEEITQQNTFAIIESSDWNKSQYKKMASSTLVLTITNVLTAFALFISVGINLKPTETVYFAMDENMMITPLIALDQPYLKDAVLTNFVSNILSETLSFSYANVDTHFETVRDNYSADGFNGIIRSIEQNKIREVIQTSRLNLITNISGNPVIVNKKLVDGVHTWFIKTPLLLSFESTRGVIQKKNLTAKTVVQRVPTIANPKGIQIIQTVFEL